MFDQPFDQSVDRLFDQLESRQQQEPRLWVVAVAAAA
jgi:hypothetical protein